MAEIREAALRVRCSVSPVWAELLEQAHGPECNAGMERVRVVYGKTGDVNCIHHIQQRFKPDEIESFTSKFRERVRELKQEHHESLRSIVKGRSGLETIKKESAA